ncbi:Rop family plasmid primer RNA-binding protein [Salmonella enterica subsp. enterica serovar Infantis]|nr:Rop family plasmid primer RNA-binding protein [Salmonella enterica subsp. enterica serovar Infantis]
MNKQQQTVLNMAGFIKSQSPMPPQKWDAIAVER